MNQAITPETLGVWGIFLTVLGNLILQALRNRRNESHELVNDGRVVQILERQTAILGDIREDQKILVHHAQRVADTWGYDPRKQEEAIAGAVKRALDHKDEAERG